MQRNPYKVHLKSASSVGASPWSHFMRGKLLLWEYTWCLLCQWTPKPLNFWRLWILKAFGARIDGTPFIHQRARIQIPWNLSLGDRACVGDRASLYSLDDISIGAHTIIAQEAYVCTGSHEFGLPERPLKTAPIKIGERCFIGARAFIMPGVNIGNESIVAACVKLDESIGDKAVIR